MKRPQPLTVLVTAVLGFILSFCATKSCNGQCPGGVCPTGYAQTQWAGNAHWSFPGDSIQDHLASSHGFDASGMTREQALTKHDELHERSRSSATLPVRTMVRNQVSGLRGRFRLRR